MAVHEFCLLAQVDPRQDYAALYQGPGHCPVTVADDWVEANLARFQLLPTYFHSLDQPGLGLCYVGVTLIPPASLGALEEICLTAAPSQYQEQVAALVTLIRQGREQGCYLLHFGI